jgi:hypothetical protein
MRAFACPAACTLVAASLVPDLPATGSLTICSLCGSARQAEVTCVAASDRNGADGATTRQRLERSLHEEHFVSAFRSYRRAR